MSMAVYSLAKLASLLDKLIELGCKYPSITVYGDGSGFITIDRSDPAEAHHLLNKSLLTETNADRLVYAYWSNYERDYNISFRSDFVVETIDRQKTS